MLVDLAFKKRRICVLLVDDQAIIGQAMRRMLAAETDIDFHYCQDPTQAVKIANQIQPTVILQDLVMPEIDGMTLVRYFRANPITREVPLIVLSRKEEGDIKAEAFAMGVDDYMVKLPDRQEVIARIRYHSRAYINGLERNEAMQALATAKQAAESANLTKSAFLANMSHKIRTPMNAILGFSDILVDLVSDSLQREYLSAIQASARSLLTLINDILDLSKVEAGKLVLEYRPVNLRLIFEDMPRIFAQKLQDKDLSFKLDISPDFPLDLLLDETRLRQILLNLIGNAVKFTEQGEIRLQVTYHWLDSKRQQLSLHIAVADTGIGIPPDQQHNIFEAFTQQQGQSYRKYGGTGLGLAISKRLVEMMQGDLSLDSTPGQGSTFTLHLHCVQVPEQRVNPSTAPAPVVPGTLQFSPATVLIADDVTLNRKLLGAYLKPYGLRLLEASNGEEAVSLATQELPDLILMDMKMPVLDGDAAVRRLRAQDSTRGIPVIAVTALAMKGDEQEICALCDEYLTKPVKKADLLTKIRPFLAHQLEASEPVAVVPSPEPRLPQPAPPGLRELLREQPLHDWQTLGPTSSVNDIQAFAERMCSLGQTHAWPPLIQWAEYLQSQAVLFNMPALYQTLADFPALLSDTELASEEAVRQ